MWPAPSTYAVDPRSAAAAPLTPEEKSRILGGEACMWTEWAPPETLDSRVWPRTAAIAERLWSPQEVADVGSMYARLAELNWRLDWLGLTPRTARFQILHPFPPTEPIPPLPTLSPLLVPVHDYTPLP